MKNKITKNNLLSVVALLSTLVTSQAALLNFGGVPTVANGGDADDSDNTWTWANIGMDNGVNLNMIATIVTTNNNDIGNESTSDTNYGTLNLKNGIIPTIRFSFENAATGLAHSVSDMQFTIVDIDGGNSSNSEILKINQATASGLTSVALGDSLQNNGMTPNYSISQTTTGGVAQPTSFTLNQEQKDHSATLYFENTSSFDLTFDLSEFSSDSARNWYFAGNITNPVPEPSSTALLGLGGLALILHRRK